MTNQTIKGISTLSTFEDNEHHPQGGDITWSA